MGFLYLIADRESLLIGRDTRNDFVINSPLISPVHVRITPSDNSNTAWIRVEGRGEVRVNSISYQSGARVMICKSDYIHVGNELILWLKNYIYINTFNDNDRTTVSAPGLRLINASKDLPGIRPEIKKIYVPSVRKRRFYDDSEIEIEAPPARRAPEKNSLMLAIGPALTMVIPILLGAGRAISVLSSVFAAFWAAGNFINQQKKHRKEEKRRRNSYLSYIAECEQRLKTSSGEFRAVLEDNYPVINAYLRGGPNPFLLWNREREDVDSFRIRVGVGECDFPNEIRIPRDRFSQVDDSLKRMPVNLQMKYRLIPKCPVLIDIKEERVIGFIYDDYEYAYSVLGAFILQMAVSFLPDAVSFGISSDNMGFTGALDWVRFLPHFKDNLLNEIDERLRSTEENNGGSGGTETAGDKICLLITDDIMQATRLVCDKNTKLILICPSLARLPSFVDKIISCRSDFYGIIGMGNAGNKRKNIRFDRLSKVMCSEYARVLGRIWGIRNNESSSVPKTVLFDRLYERDISAEDIAAAWRSADTSKSLGFPIGMGDSDRIIYLDLHEAHAGPHGIIAGTTGSGKSELLTTIILSAALNYPPDKLGFFLIDYKGGGMSNLFRKLPHVMGAISNLSDTEINRAMISIKSENLRRQKIFNDCAVNNIRDYARKYDEGRADIALPHVFIIIDEFAELKKENPDFMQELISVAAVGRSLGVHLILATQKPAGVVDDKIRSNSRFRICLRVEDKMDSGDMLHNHDAALIKECGRGYLQVGNNEIYEYFQSAYAMGEKSDTNVNYKVIITDENGEDLSECSRATAEQNAVNAKKNITWHEYLLEEIVRADLQISYKSPEKLWMPPLPSIIKSTQISFGSEADISPTVRYIFRNDEFSINSIPIGIADDPMRQAYKPVVFDIKKCGNTAVIGMPGCGKSGILRAILVGITEKYDSRQINIFIVDNGGNRLKLFKDSNICGGYINSDNSGHFMMLLYHIREIMNDRRRNLENENVQYPHQLLIVDNYSESVRSCLETAEAIFQDIIKYGPSVGISVILSSVSVGMGELPARFLDVMDTVFCLGRMETYQVAGYIKQPVSKIPHIADFPGRGVTVIGEDILEFQALDLDDNARITYDIIKNNDEKPEKSPAYPYIPDDPCLKSFLERAVKEVGQEEIIQRGLPVGYEEKTGKLFCLPIGNIKITLVIGKEGTGKHSFVDILTAVAARYDVRTYTADNTNSLLDKLTVKRTDDTSFLLITISNIEKVLKDNPGDIEILKRAFDNSGKNRSNVHIVAIFNGRDRVYEAAEELWEALMKKPYVMCFGGNLDEQRLFDFSYLPYAKLSEEKEAGRCHVRRFGKGMFYGDVLIPQNELMEFEE